MNGVQFRFRTSTSDTLNCPAADKTIASGYQGHNAATRLNRTCCKPGRERLAQTMRQYFWLYERNGAPNLRELCFAGEASEQETPQYKRWRTALQNGSEWQPGERTAGCPKRKGTEAAHQNHGIDYKLGTLAEPQCDGPGE